MNLCKEVVDGIRIMFDTYLGPILLYKPEVSQFKKLATFYRPVLPKKVLFPGPVIMPSRLRSQSRVTAHSDNAANAETTSDAPGVATSTSDLDVGVDVKEAAPSGSNDGFMSDADSNHSGLLQQIDKRENEAEDEDDAGLSTTSSSNARPKIEPTFGDDKENDADAATSFVSGGGGGGGGGAGEEMMGEDRTLSEPDGSSNDGGSTEGGSSSARVGHLGRAYLASSRDRLSDALIEAIESWRLVSDETIQKFPNSPSLLYGAHHFLRLFVHLPKLLSLLTDINGVKLNAILFHVEGILNYMEDNAEFFLSETFANSALVVDELNANCARNKLH